MSFSVFDIFNTIKEKFDEYEIGFTSEDLPGGGKQLGVNYRGGNFKIRIMNNKIDGASVDWSLVKNQTVTDELQRALEGSLDKAVLKSSVYRSDDPTINIIGSDESGKGDLFGGVVVAAAWIHPEKCDTLRNDDELNIKDSKELEDIECVKTFTKLINGETHVEKSIGDGYTSYHISPADNRFQVVVVVTTPMDYNRGLCAHKTPERLLESLHLLAIGDLVQLLHERKCTDVDDLVAVIDQFIPSLDKEKQLCTTVYDQAKEFGFKEFSIELRPQAEQHVLACALASIFARVYFLNQVTMMGNDLGFELPLGSGKGPRKTYEKHFEGLEDQELAKFMKLQY